MSDNLKRDGQVLEHPLATDHIVNEGNYMAGDILIHPTGFDQSSDKYLLGMTSEQVTAFLSLIKLSEEALMLCRRLALSCQENYPDAERQSIEMANAYTDFNKILLPAIEALKKVILE